MLNIENELTYAFVVYALLKFINLLFQFKFNSSLIITYLVSLLSIANLTTVVLPKIFSYIPRVMLEGGMKYMMSKKMIGRNDIFQLVLFQEVGGYLNKRIFQFQFQIYILNRKLFSKKVFMPSKAINTFLTLRSFW